MKIFVFDRIKLSIALLRRSQFHYYRMSMTHPPFWLAAKGKVCRVFSDSTAGARACYAEVLVTDCYRLFPYAKHNAPRVIADIGANVGMFSRLCTLLFPEADVFAYEPHPAAIPWLHENAKDTRIRVIPCAVQKNQGMQRMSAGQDSTVGQVGPTGGFSVQCISAAEVAQGMPIDLLKMDCEGSEWSILEDASLLGRTQDFCMEYHLDESRSLAHLEDLIRSAGHRVLKVSPKAGYHDRFGTLWSTQQLP